MLAVKFVDLYKELGVPRAAAAGGTLCCWLGAGAEAVAPLRRRSAVLLLPGGGYGHLSAREEEPVALRFLARGWAAFSLRYSVAPARHPTQLREAAMAMRYLRDSAASLGIGRVAVVGFSAGGHLAGMLGTLFDSALVRDLAPARQLRPDALGLCYPVTAPPEGATGAGAAESFRNLTGGTAEEAAALRLQTLVRPDMPPVYLWHTRDDESVPVGGSLRLACALDAAGVRFAMRIYHHGRHGISLANAQVYPSGQVPAHSPQIEDWPEEMLLFFAECGMETGETE